VDGAHFYGASGAHTSTQDCGEDIEQDVARTACLDR
jgi:hypothetical protein